MLYDVSVGMRLERPFDRSPKHGTELFEFMEPKFGVRGYHGLLGG